MMESMDNDSDGLSLDEQQPFPQLPRSGLGVASCVAFGLALACIIIGGVSLSALPPPGGSDFPQGFGQAIASGFLIMFGWGASCVGVLLGIGGLFQQDRESVTPTLGLALNALPAGFILLWVLGNS
jgi:hypothetical protein